MGWLTIRNWDKWQTYRKDRPQPNWIKLHRDLMRNPDWIALSDSQRGHLVSIWMLAADKNGRIPDDPKLVQRMCFLDKPPDIKLLIAHGFLDGCQVVTKPPQTVGLEESRGEIEESRGERRAHALPKDWLPTENHFSYGESRGFDAAKVEDVAEAMRFWAWGKGELRKDWDMTFSGFLRREQGRGTGPPRREQQFTDAVQQHMAKVQARAGSNGNSRRDVCGESGKHDLRLVHKSDSEHATDARAIDRTPNGEAENNRGSHVRSEGGGGG